MANIFRFASSELSHSAYFAWLIQEAIDAPRSPAGMAGRAVLDVVVGRDFQPKGEAKTELPAGGASKVRFDVYVEGDGGRALIIEAKVSARASVRQLRDYAATNPTAHLAFVSLAWHFDPRHLAYEMELPDSSRFRVIGWRDWLAAIEAHAGHHLVRTHCDWLQEQAKQERAWENALLSGIYEAAVLDAGANHLAWRQWVILRVLMARVQGFQKSGISLGGTPWTEWWFTTAADRDGDDACFFRLEPVRGRFLLTVKLHRRRASEEGRERAVELWKAWSQVEDALADHFIRPREPGDKKARTLAKYELTAQSWPVISRSVAPLAERIKRQLGRTGPASRNLEKV